MLLRCHRCGIGYKLQLKCASVAKNQPVTAFFRKLKVYSMPRMSDTTRANQLFFA
jgi:hypothetical protein